MIEAQNLKSCLACHAKHQIPDELIYKRYLLRYSTKERIKNAIINYLQNPNPKHSIMPPQFFTKFPQKPKQNFSKKELQKGVSEYIEHFDIQKRLQ